MSRSAAADLYVGELFRRSLRYARALRPDGIFILSAKHGLVAPDTEVEPYDVTLNRMPAAARRAWANRVLEQLREVVDLAHDRFTILAGARYREHLVPRLGNVDVPTAGMRIGEQLRFLGTAAESTSGLCRELHELVRRRRLFGFPFPAASIPRNGIYILFEEGEVGHGANRIVRVGTHTGANQLRSRLRQHFVQPKKDRSIFRKNIGRALLAHDDDPFLRQWEIDLTTRAARERYGATIDAARLAAVEARVTETIQGRFRFAVFEVPERDRRLHLEARLVSTVSRCDACGPSDGWLGRYSPKEKIRRSGLWQVNELYKEPLSPDDLRELRGLPSG